MNSAAALISWLDHRTPGELTELLDGRDLPRAAAYGQRGIENTADLAAHLLSDVSVTRAVAELRRDEIQLLIAVVSLAEEIHGPTGAADDKGDPLDRAVPRELFLHRLTADPAVRKTAAESLDSLAARLLVLPAADGHLAVPALIHRRATELQGLGEKADTLLSAAFNAPEVLRIAQALNLSDAKARDEAQRRIVAYFSDPDAVRALIADAPAKAQDILRSLTSGPEYKTTCFTAQYGYYSTTAPTKFLFRQGSSDEPDAAWLAERGLLIPVGTGLTEMPYEVGRALRQKGERPEYEPNPPVISEQKPVPKNAAGQAQAAAAKAATTVELLLQNVAAQPLSVRKAGGIAVRDTARLAKALSAVNATEDETRFWLELAANAGLIAPHRDEPPAKTTRKATPAPAQILPTAAYDAWLAATPADRLLPLIATWAVVPAVLTDKRDAALTAPHDKTAAIQRHALLEALAGLPEGQGAAAGTSAPTAWFRPAAQATEATPATLREAELLGVTAHGALTPVGHAVQKLLNAGAARHFPAIPGARGDLTDRPTLQAAVRELSRALSDLLPAPQTTARFQADLTAVVVGTPSAELTKLLSSAADRESEGHAVVWRFSSASVRRALDSGVEADQLLKNLNRISATELPQALDYLIKDIARTHGKIKVVRSTCCIRSDDEALVLELAQTRTLARLGLRRIAPTVLISTADPEATLAALRAAGFAPVLEAETGGTLLELGPSARAENPVPSIDQTQHHHGPGAQSATELTALLLNKNLEEHSHPTP